WRAGPGGRPCAASRADRRRAHRARPAARQHPPARLMLRRPILAAADSAPVRGFVDRYGMRLGAQRFVAGETLDQAVVVLRRLNEQGLRTNTTLLGENVGDPDEAEEVTATYEEVLRRIDAEQLQT